jgi:mono/diheme cytochrome c family protein
MGRQSLIAGAAAVLMAGCMPSSGDRAPAPTAAERGASWFGAYCVSCHGESARGDGPAAAALDPRPADLTTIAARNARSFDAERVAAYIDGRTTVQSHGSSAMPVWGRPMDDRNEQIASTETLLDPVAIHQIVSYLETLQRESGSAQ